MSVWNMQVWHAAEGGGPVSEKVEIVRLAMESGASVSDTRSSSGNPSHRGCILAEKLKWRHHDWPGRARRGTYGGFAY